VACETLSLVEYAGDEATFVRASGNIEILKHLKGFRKWDYITTLEVGYSAAKEGHLDTLLYFFAGDSPQQRSIWPTLCFAAVCGGNLHILEWLKTQNALDINITYTAGRYGDIRVAEWILTLYPNSSRDITEGAVRYGQIELLKWLYVYTGRRATDWQNITVQTAVECGVLEVVKWIHSIGRPWGRAAEAATNKGHLDILKWMRSLPERERCPWGAVCSENAASGGHLNMLKWMRGLPANERCPWNTGTAAHAAMHGHLDTIKWMRSLLPVEERCPWDEKTTTNAASFGHLELLIWTRGLPPDERCPWGVSAISSWRRGGIGGGVMPLGYTHTSRGDIDTTIRWMRSHPGDDRCPWDEDAATVAVAVCSLETFQWMRTQPEEDRCPWNMSEILRQAVVSSRLDILEWIHSLPPHERTGWSVDKIRGYIDNVRIYVDVGKIENYLNSLPMEG
jgi:hypothetical protein